MGNIAGKVERRTDLLPHVHTHTHISAFNGSMTRPTLRSHLPLETLLLFLGVTFSCTCVCVCVCVCVCMCARARTRARVCARTRPRVCEACTCLYFVAARTCDSSSTCLPTFLLPRSGTDADFFFGFPRRDSVGEGDGVCVFFCLSFVWVVRARGPDNDPGLGPVGFFRADLGVLVGEGWEAEASQIFLDSVNRIRM